MRPAAEQPCAVAPAAYRLPNELPEHAEFGGDTWAEPFAVEVEPSNVDESEPAGQEGGRARRHSLWTSHPSTTSTTAMTPVG
jgi:hypothetical protein